jgi:hypothetical protein
MTKYGLFAVVGEHRLGKVDYLIQAYNKSDEDFNNFNKFRGNRIFGGTLK